MTSMVSNVYDLEDYLDNDENISLDELLNIFKKKYSNELDFSDLEDCIYNHNCDMELRHGILQLVSSS